MARLATPKDLNYYTEQDHVLLAVDCIIFGFDKEELKLLVIKRNFEPEQGKWSLIGGFLRKSENLDQAAIRVLQKLTGLNNVYLEQLYVHSKIDRDPGQRTISVSYFALIDLEDRKYKGQLIDSAQWFNLEELPKLIFDHDTMVKQGLERLRQWALTKPIGFELLPKKFSMRQLQNLYESILGRELDKRNFIKKIQSLDILMKLDEKDKSNSRKGSFLYVFDKKKYYKRLKEGFYFKI